MDVLIVVQGGKVNVGKIRNRNLKNIIMNITGLRKTHRVDFNPRPVVHGCAGCAMAHPIFCRSVNPISTRGDRVCPPNTVDGKGSLSNNFSVIFPSFVHLLATKPMAKQSRASGTLSEGHWVEYRADFLLFFLQIFKIHQIFRQFYFS